jgi:hypothetical protein
MNACLLFLRGIGLLGENEEAFSKKPRADMPWLIVAWIMNALVLFSLIWLHAVLMPMCRVEAVIPLILTAQQSHPVRNGERMAMLRRCEHQ